MGVVAAELLQFKKEAHGDAHASSGRGPVAVVPIVGAGISSHTDMGQFSKVTPEVGQAQEAGQWYSVVPEALPREQMTCVLLSRAQNIS